MIPILYKSDEVDFYDNGLGALTEIYDVEVQEQRNGLFTLTATYPVSGQRYKDIEVGRIIYAKPNQNDDPQAFRIVHTELDISGYNLTIEADHITYDLTHNMVKKVHLQGDGQNAMTALQNATTAPHMFRFVSDLQHIGDSTLQYVNPMEAIAGTQGSILQIWGGELKRGNRTVSMLSRRGRDNFTTFRLGKNINGLKYTVDTTNLVTRIIPTITQTNAVNKEYFIAGDSVDSKNIKKYPNVYIQHVDMGDEVTVEENESEDSIKAKINAKAKNWFTQSANTHVDLPQITVEIDVTSLQDSADYQDEFKNLEAIELTDTVTVYVPEFGVNVQAIVNELHFDPMTERVTSIVVGTSKTSFVDANANQFSALENKINQIRQDAVTAIVSSNGKNTNYYSNKEPQHPVEGDLWFKQVGDDMYIMVFKDGHWVELVSTRTQEMIEKAVDDAIKQANAYTDELNEKQAKEVQEFRTKYDKELDDAKTEREDLDKKISEIDDETTQKLVEANEDRKRIEDKATQLVSDANDHAQELADNAVSTAKAEASKALTSANKALDEAKTDLTTNLNKEISERQQAVQTVNSQAQSYANQAKSDAIAAATTADGQVRRDFKATTDSLTSTISQNKQDTDGKISTAQSTATQALNGLKTKVSQTDYNTKTGQLQTGLTETSQTANQAKLDIASIKSEADSQSAQINDIVSDARGTKQTVSDLKTEQGKQSGSIATLQSRADGFDATVTKVNNLSVGGRNLYTDTKNFDNQAQWLRFSSWTKTTDTYNGLTVMQTTNSWNGISQYIPVKKGDVLTYSVYAKYTSGTGTSNVYWMLNNDPEGIYSNATTNITNNQVTITDSWQRISGTTVATSDGYLRPRLERTDNNVNILQIAGIKVEKGNLPTDWSPAPEDLSGATAKAQLTADKATLDLSNYKTDANGRISKAQSDITATSKEVKTKVSQSDYDAKTGDLTTKYGQVKATADAVTTDVSKYKTANDKKVSANSASINTLNNQITSKVSQTDFDKKTGELSGKYTETKQTVDKISNTVTELQAKANAQGQINQLTNTEFNPDLEGWSVSADSGSRAPYRSGFDKNVQATMVGFNTTDSLANTYTTLKQDVQIGSAGGGFVSLSWQSWAPTFANYANLWVRFYDSNNQQLDEQVKQWTPQKSDGSVVGGLWTRQKFEGIAIPSGAVKISVFFQAREGINAYLVRPMLVFDDHIGDYAQGNYNNNARVSALELDVKGIHGTVNDPKKGLSATWNLANNGQTIAVKAQKDATTAIQTAKGIQTQVNSNDGDIKNLQSTLTQTAKQITTEVADRKSGDSAVETRMKDLVNTQITSVTKGYTSLNSQTEQSFKTQIKNVSDKLNDLGQINLLKNSEFNPDLEGWELTSDGGNTRLPYRSYLSKDINATTVGFNTMNSATSSWSNMSQTVQLSSTATSGTTISLSWSSWAREVANYNGLHILFYDNKDTQVGDEYKEWTARGGGGSENSYAVRKKWENITVPDTATYLVLKFQAREGTGAYLAQPMLVFGSTIGSYTPGNYNNNNLVESTRVQLNNLIKDQITNVKDQISTTKTQTDKQITNEISDRKNGDSTLNTQLRNYIGTQVSSVTSGYKSAIEQSADTIMASVSTPNLLLNTNFTPDLENWNVSQKGGTTNDTFYRSILDDQGHTGVGVHIPDNAGSDSNRHYAYLEQDIQMPGWKNNVKLSLSWRIQVRHMLNYAWLWIQFLDGNKNHMLKSDGSQNSVGYNYGATGNNADGKWHDGKFENIAVPNGCVYIRVSFQAREGTNLYLTSPMATFTSKAQSYTAGSYSGMNTQTVLKLAKDNWALGIADNAGRIISGINGDKSGTLIQGKRLIINSDTTINGKAFIDGSVIKNASIGKAQIGNASVGSAQIINLDVSKLSGNIANFITGNIKTLNSHVLYGDTGHLNTTDTGRIINKQDNHLQLASKGFYDSTNNRAQLELLGNSDSHISADMKGSLNYYGNPTDKGHGLGIRLKYNQILAIDEDRGSKMLYLSPYQGGEVRVVSRDLKAYYPVRASSFNAMSSRSAKSNIVPFEDCALDIVKKTKVRTYIKNNKQEIGVISDEADPRMLTDDDNAVSLYDYTSILYKAVQELTAKVEELENGKS